MLKKFSWSVFVIVLFCSIMPFTSISCGQQKITTMTGVQLSTGMTLNIAGEEQKMDPNPSIMAAFACAALAAIVLLISKSKPAFAVALLSAVAGTGSLIFFKIKMDEYVAKEGQGMIGVVYEPGFWICLALFVIGIVVSGMGASVEKDENQKIEQPK